MSEFDYNNVRQQGRKHIDEGKKTFWSFFWKIGVFILILVIGANVLGFFGDGAKLLKQELSPTAIQKKYEWFKDASASLDAKSAAIEVNKQAVTDLQETYGKDMKSWPRDVRQDLSMTRAELRGSILSYNRLRAEYNSQSSKWNWERFEGKSPLNQNYKELSE